MPEQSSIYTRKGDKGTTSLYGGTKVPKTASHIEVVGSLDELNASLGVVATTPELRIKNHELSEIIHQIQNLLFNLGAEIADIEKKTTIKKVSEKHTSDLERLIDHFDSQLPKLTTFILPGGSQAGAELHRARTVCRRAERAVVKLSNESDINHEINKFLNRLGDFLFVFARYINHLQKNPETTWRK